ncbi:ATP-binding protein [Aliivibrio sifiae]|uniref:ATP-binding protein n=1 Tax=Aliivibrio sifiae TaxID=566293 RepID=UPI003D11CF3A
MWRIYIESFIRLFFFFIFSLFAYDEFVYQLSSDYDYVLEDMESAAFQRILLRLSECSTNQELNQYLLNYADLTASNLNLVHPEELPEDVKNYFALNEKIHSFSFRNEDRHLWITFPDVSNFYHFEPDTNSMIREKISFNDSLFFVFIIGGFLIYSISLIWFLNRRILVLELVTADIARGNLNARVPTNSGSKVGGLNESVNDMADKISQLISNNRTLAQAVAHDLRTPIFRIQWQAELIQESTIIEDVWEKVASIIEDTEEMEQLVNELLYFTKISSQEIPLHKELFLLEPFINHLVKRLYNPKNREIEVIIDPDVYLLAATNLFKPAIDNALSNAVRYAESKVRLVCQSSKQQLKIIIEDDGPGIPEKYWGTVFEPFFSLDPSRNKENMGNGLGLAIVKLTVEKHGGQVILEKSELGGVKLNLIIPNLQL